MVASSRIQCSCSTCNGNSTQQSCIHFFNEMVMLFTTECICNCERIPKNVTCSLKNPWHGPGTLCNNHTQTNYAPFSLPASIRFYLPLSPGVDIRGGEREIAISGLPFSEILRLHLRVLHLVFAWLFPVIDQIYFEITKHIKSIRS